MNQNEKPKRKTFTSSAVKARYNAKTYRKISLNLRYDSDSDVIEAIDQLKSQGLQTSAAVIQLIRKGMNR